jgi:hypothetical protein
MTEIPIDPHTRRVITPSFEGLVDTVLAGVRGWVAQRRAARVARELDALSDTQLEMVGLARRGERS